MNHALIVALIQNAGLLLGMVVVFDYLTARQNLNATPVRQGLAGLAIGLIGVAMIVISVPLESGIMFDTRSVLLSVSGLFLGLWPTVIAMSMAAVYRVFVGGEGAVPGVAVILTSGAIGVLWRYLRRKSLEAVGWKELYALGLIVHLTMLCLMFTLGWDAGSRVVAAIGVPVMIVHPTATLVLGILFARRLRHHRTAAELVESERRYRHAAESAQAAEKDLLAAQQLAQSTLDALPEYICVLDEKGRILASNDAWRQFGRANQARLDSIGEGASYLSVCESASGQDAELGRAVASSLRSLLKGRTSSFSLEYPCDSPDEKRWFEMTASRFPGEGPTHVVVAHTDITNRKHAESELRRLTQILEGTQAAARVGGWELDLLQGSLFWTEETYRIHDVQPAEYTPTLESAFEFFSPESVALLEAVITEATWHGTARETELELVTRAGVHKWVQFTPSVTRELDRTVRITCAIQDITARREAERERLELTAQLYQTQKLESLGSLAGGVAHDINNVLAAILSSAAVHRKRLESGDPLARSLDTITNACLRGRSVVRSLLSFVRGDIGARGPVDVNEVVREIVELLESTTLSRVVFRIDLDEHVPEIVADRGGLAHALMNLCINSLDAMPGGGTVTIQTLARPDGGVQLSVSDTGIGMAPETRERAIEPFFTTKPPGKGTGLGLAMVYGTVKAHNGTLEIISSPESGTEVIIGLSSNASADVPHAQAEKEHPEEQTETSSVLRILLVDDDELIRSAIAALLEMEGHEVHVAEGGAEALQCLESGLDVDLILLDMNMPGMNGEETLSRLLQIRPAQAVLLSSGHRDEEMLSMTGPSNILTIQKPYTLDELNGKLEALGLKKTG